MVEPQEIAELELIARHIRERLAKSQMASPQIAISRDGWDLILQLIEALPMVMQATKDLEALIAHAILAESIKDPVSHPGETSTPASSPQ